MSDVNKLQVIIVGSGLAGLTAARILREHHHVTVYERGDPAIATGGQGIIIAPNGVKILDSIGYDRARAGAVPIYGIRVYEKDEKVKEDVDMDLKARFGADFLSQKRSDFRDELMRLATAPSADLGIKGSPAKMVFNTAVVGLDPDEGVVTLGDGSTASADVVISESEHGKFISPHANKTDIDAVADGIHSRLRASIVGDDKFVAKKTGLTCYRTAVSLEDAQKALAHRPLPHWWEPSTCQNRSSLILSADGSARMVTAYPIRHQTYFNLSCIVQTQDSTKSTTESWNADGDRDKMVEHFSDFHESLKIILGAATEVKVWEMQDLEPLPTWTRGRCMLIGDAAHAMTPMQGQGANMSIEDAESLRLLTHGTRREDVSGLLKLAESVRRPRTAHVLDETRKSHSIVGVAERVNRNLEFNCGYNGIHSALKALQEEEERS